ncbi:hypothetical protein Tco_0980139 [Tanacetum coccineum]
MLVSWRGSHTWIVVAPMADGCVMVGAMLLILIIRGRDEFNQVAAALFPVSGVVLVVELLMLLMTAVVICLITDDVTADLRRTMVWSMWKAEGMEFREIDKASTIGRVMLFYVI